MRELQGHLTEEWLNAWRDKNLTDEEERRLLMHVSCCSHCADRFAQILEEEPAEPPAYLKEEILERSRGLDVQAAKTVYHTSRRMRLFLYSLKVGLAVAASLFLLFGTSGKEPEVFHVNWETGQTPASITDTLDEGSRKMGGYLRQLTDRLWDMNEEELYD